MIDRIKVGDVLKDGHDREHTVLSLDGPEERPIVTKAKGCGFSFAFTPQGHYYNFGPSGLDLILPKRTRTITRWVNVYDHEEACHYSEGEAKSFAGRTALAVAVPVTFTVEY